MCTLPGSGESIRHVGPGMVSISEARTSLHMELTFLILKNKTWS